MAVSVPILMYHRVAPLKLIDVDQFGAGVPTMTVDDHAFASQMAWLVSHGYSTISLDQLVAARHNGTTLPRLPIVITFDDGYQDCVEHAVPAMQQHGFTATFFLVSARVGMTSDWDDQRSGWSFPLFDWATARSLMKDGFEIGAHTASHPVLTELAGDEAEREIHQSKSEIEQQTGQEVRHFAYPHGAFSDRERNAVIDAGFQSACSVIQGRSPHNDDLFALRRIEITGFDSLTDFQIRMWGYRPPWVWRRWFRRRLGLTAG